MRIVTINEHEEGRGEKEEKRDRKHKTQKGWGGIRVPLKCVHRSDWQYKDKK